ncbi:MAG: UTRA domain-containing protein [Pseudomonadota bacterium]
MQPRYAHIKSYITARIDDGSWRPGERIASEHELVRLVGASRMTVNRAVRELSDEGLLTRVPGVGTFVAEARLQHPASYVREIREDIEARGARYGTDVLDLEAARPEPDLAVAFSGARADRLFRSRLLHRADDAPVLFEDRWVSPAIAPDYLDQDYTRISPTRYLLAVAPLQRIEQRIQAIVPDPALRSLLQLAPTDPVLLVTRRSWSRDAVASVAWLYYAGTRYALDMGAEALPPLPAPHQLRNAP